MSLYLCVFAGEEEAAGVDAGSYGDFNAFRRCVCVELEQGVAGLRFPTLNRHSDCDGEWSERDCANLREELGAIAAALRDRPAAGFPSAWQEDLARSLGIAPRNALECFLDADGQFLLERLFWLTAVALRRRQPILFQ